MITYIEDHINEIVIHMETRGTYTIKERCKVFLNKLCEHYGSSYEGRIQAICACLNIHQKAPVLIREGMILYPLADALTKNNVWVNYCMVKKIRPCLNFMTVHCCYQTVNIERLKCNKIAVKAICLF